MPASIKNKPPPLKSLPPRKAFPLGGRWIFAEGKKTDEGLNALISLNREPLLVPLGSKACERVLWTIKRGFYAAAVEKAEDQRFPDGFFAHRKGAV